MKWYSWETFQAPDCKGRGVYRCLQAITYSNNLSVVIQSSTVHKFTACLVWSAGNPGYLLPGLCMLFPDQRASYFWHTDLTCRGDLPRLLASIRYVNPTKCIPWQSTCLHSISIFIFTSMRERWRVLGLAYVKLWASDCWVETRTGACVTATLRLW